VKEGKNRRKIAFRAVVVGGVLISAAAVALYTPWLGLFDLRAIRVSGNHHVSAAQVGQAAGLSRGRPLLAISCSAVSERISQIPWVREVRVSRAFPHTLHIEVTERISVAVMSLPDGRCVMLGDGGVVVAEGCQESATELELVGAELTQSETGGKLVEPTVVELIDAVRGPLDLETNIRRIDVSDLSSVILEAESGLRILLGAIDSHAQRLARLSVLGREIDLSAYRTIDLRLEGEATLVTW